MNARKAINLNVHGARGLFSLMVFVFHINFSGLETFGGGIGQAQTLLLPTFKFGVELFFGISGIVIVGAVARAHSFRAFIWDRMTRIFPVLWASLFVITAMMIAAGSSSAREMPDLGVWLANFLAPPPFFDIRLIHPAAWSLGYEFTFYAIVGIGYFLHRRGVAGALAVATAVGIALLCLYPRGMLMAAGVLIALGIGAEGRLAAWARFPIINLLIFLALWRIFDGILGGYITHLSPLHMPFLSWLAFLPAILVTFAFGAVALLGISQGHGSFGRLLRTSGVQWLGTISYSFYIWHPIIIAIAKQALVRTGLAGLLGQAAQIGLGLVAIGPALVASHYSQKFLELRVTMWLRRRGPEGRAAEAPVSPTIGHG